MGSIVRGFKIGVTKWFRQNTRVHVVWQRNFYEHIIRNDDSLNRIREYIMYNPIRWAADRDNPNGDGEFGDRMSSFSIISYVFRR